MSLNDLKTLIKKANKDGIPLPMAKDWRDGKSLPSVSLLFVYISFIVMIVSAIALHVKTEYLSATVTLVLIWILAMVFYMIRRLKSFKADLDDKSINLEGEDENEEK